MGAVKLGEIKNVRERQAIADFKKEWLNYYVLNEVLEEAGDFGDIEGACKCQQRKRDVYGRSRGHGRLFI